MILIKCVISDTGARASFPNLRNWQPAGVALKSPTTNTTSTSCLEVSYGSTNISRMHISLLVQYQHGNTSFNITDKNIRDTGQGQIQVTLVPGKFSLKMLFSVIGSGFGEVTLFGTYLDEEDCDQDKGQYVLL